MYIRFEGPGGQGLFQLADAKLFRRENVPIRERSEARKLRAWLWKHTPGPPAWAYESDDPQLYPSTWFRDDVYGGYIPRAKRLAELLSNRGVRLRVAEVRELPGRVVYKDKVQAVAWSEGGRLRAWRIAPRAGCDHAGRNAKTCSRRGILSMPPDPRDHGAWDR